MSYVPPHKRHSSRDANKPAPSPDSLAPQFNQSLNLGVGVGSSQRRRNQRPYSQQYGNKIIYASGAVSLWWPVGSPAGDDPIPASFRLEPVPCEPVERKTGVKPLVLAGPGDLTTGENGDERPWEMIGERIEPFLFDSVQRARDQTGSEAEEFKLSFIARVGKVHFDGGVCLDSIKKVVAVEADSSNQVRKSFYTSISNAYMEDIHHVVVPKIGLQFEAAKEHYIVKVFDNTRRYSTISCKCIVSGDGSELEIRKIETNPVRHMVVDISCLYKDLDLRLMLVNKRTIKSPTDEEKTHINELIKSAILDPNVKGGLRWPLGKTSVADRFNVVGVWHTHYKAFRGPTMRLKLRNADRFDFRGSTGEVSDEVSMKLTGISKKLRDGDFERETLIDMVREEVKLIWEHFLSYKDESA